MSESISNIIDTHYETLEIWQTDAPKITQSPFEQMSTQNRSTYDVLPNTARSSIDFNLNFNCSLFRDNTLRPSCAPGTRSPCDSVAVVLANPFMFGRVMHRCVVNGFLFESRGKCP